jgi:hypothetical protein
MYLVLLLVLIMALLLLLLLLTISAVPLHIQAASNWHAGCSRKVACTCCCCPRLQVGCVCLPPHIKPLPVSRRMLQPR